MKNKNLHLNRTLYEFYPFVYFIFGTAFYLLLNNHEILRIVILLACFGAGFTALMIRFKHRSIYKKAKSKLDKKLWMAKPVYEVIPVVYIGIGMLLIAKTNHISGFIAGLALATFGCYFVLSRIIFRLVLVRD